ncbi:MAG: CapA family protein [Gammaproteobacteria bacterium]|nr:MAG: CapA family protein [Gammaproteobacteria bacterium]
MYKSLFFLLITIFTAHNIYAANQQPSQKSATAPTTIKTETKKEKSAAAAVKSKAPQKPATVTIAAVGDMMVGNWGENLLAKNGANYPFEKVAKYLQKADIATGNLEGPHCTTGKAMEKRFTFKIKPSYLSGYKWAGFDVLTVSNNHAMDYGAKCFLQSNAAVEKLGIKVCGGGKNLSDANKPAVIERNGISVAVLGYSATYPKEAWANTKRAGTVYPERSRVISAVSKAAKKHDLVVVHFHWGGEGRKDPKQYQKNLAHLAIDHGADLIIGHHPHILQGIESYKGRLIFYSLGNFTFASYTKRSKTSAIANVTLNKDGTLNKASVIPLNIYNYQVHLQPIPLPEDPSILSELRKISGMIGKGTPAKIGKDGSISLK